MLASRVCRWQFRLGKMLWQQICLRYIRLKTSIENVCDSVSIYLDKLLPLQLAPTFRELYL